MRKSETESDDGKIRVTVSGPIVGKCDRCSAEGLKVLVLKLSRPVLLPTVSSQPMNTLHACFYCFDSWPMTWCIRQPTE